MKFESIIKTTRIFFFKKKKLQAHDGDPITCYFFAISVERSKNGPSEDTHRMASALACLPSWHGMYEVQVQVFSQHLGPTCARASLRKGCVVLTFSSFNASLAVRTQHFAERAQHPRTTF